MSADLSNRTSTSKIREDLMHWFVETFTKADDIQTTLVFAEEALGWVDLPVVWDAHNGGWIVIGAAPAVVVAVSAAPVDNGTFVAVTATSESGELAQEARDQVVARIQQERLIH
jgi:hypothetical protein